MTVLDTTPFMIATPASGVIPDAYDPGAEYSIQARKQEDDGTWTVATVYMCSDEDEAHRFLVRSVEEVIACTDPDDPSGTEQRSDYNWDQDAPVFFYHTREGADRAAREAVEDWGRNAVESWGGTLTPVPL